MCVFESIVLEYNYMIMILLIDVIFMLYFLRAINVYNNIYIISKNYKNFTEKAIKIKIRNNYEMKCTNSEYIYNRVK